MSALPKTLRSLHGNRQPNIWRYMKAPIRSTPPSPACRALLHQPKLDPLPQLRISKTYRLRGQPLYGFRATRSEVPPQVVGLATGIRCPLPWSNVFARSSSLPVSSLPRSRWFRLGSIRKIDVGMAGLFRRPRSAMPVGSTIPVQARSSGWAALRRMMLSHRNHLSLAGLRGISMHFLGWRGALSRQMQALRYWEWRAGSVGHRTPVSPKSGNALPPTKLPTKYSVLNVRCRTGKPL